MSDLISRQDAIDALGEEPPVWYDGDDEIAERNQWRRDKAAIESLPSADRPTGECRTCGRNADNGGVHEDGRTKCPIQEHYALLLDGYCHLYEPYNCGAKMKGGDSE